jgi:glycosyltransferase involved in cell wall biosynthesis
MKISVIIPCKNKGDLCPELLPALKNQSFKSFETIIATNKNSSKNPAQKRNWAANKAKGVYLAFIDSDAYPNPDWLKNAFNHLMPNHITAVCGPNLTPHQNNILKKASGLVWSSWLGAGGAGTYRNKISKPRFTTDFPSSNLVVKKKDFNKVKGFNTLFWPGEDTKLCHDLCFKLRKKILYHPSIKVFHHRRPVFIPHLKQISRFGFHRGLFTKILPKTSLKLGYFIPSLFLAGLIMGPLISLPLYLLTLKLYLLLLITTAIYHRSPLLIPTLFLTHLTYGFFFIKGLLSSTRLSPLKPSATATG